MNVNAAPAGVYLASSGESSASTLTVQVLDASGQTVPNPTSGNSAFNNVQVEGCRHRRQRHAHDQRRQRQAQTGGDGEDAHAQRHRWRHYIERARYRVRCRFAATADAADNNVDNGITTPVVATKTIIVSDGKLYSLTISPNERERDHPNTVSGELSTDATNAPPDPDATQPDGERVGQRSPGQTGASRNADPASASSTKPVSAYNAGAYANRFLHSGTDGDPAEGGNIFTSLSADFIRSNGNGVGPGDALLVFGKSVDGNSDLEAR